MEPTCRSSCNIPSSSWNFVFWPGLGLGICSRMSHILFRTSCSTSVCHRQRKHGLHIRKWGRVQGPWSKILIRGLNECVSIHKHKHLAGGKWEGGIGNPLEINVANCHVSILSSGIGVFVKKIKGSLGRKDLLDWVAQKWGRETPHPTPCPPSLVPPLPMPPFHHAPLPPCPPSTMPPFSPCPLLPMPPSPHAPLPPCRPSPMPPFPICPLPHMPPSPYPMLPSPYAPLPLCPPHAPPPPHMPLHKGEFISFIHWMVNNNAQEEKSVTNQLINLSSTVLNPPTIGSLYNSFGISNVLHSWPSLLCDWNNKDHEDAVSAMW